MASIFSDYSKKYSDKLVYGELCVLSQGIEADWSRIGNDYGWGGFNAILKGSMISEASSQLENDWKIVCLKNSLSVESNGFFADLSSKLKTTVAYFLYTNYYQLVGIAWNEDEEINQDYNDINFISRYDHLEDDARQLVNELIEEYGKPFIEYINTDKNVRFYYQENNKFIDKQCSDWEFFNSVSGDTLEYNYLLHSTKCVNSEITLEELRKVYDEMNSVYKVKVSYYESIIEDIVKKDEYKTKEEAENAMRESAFKLICEKGHYDVVCDDDSIKVDNVVFEVVKTVK